MITALKKLGILAGTLLWLLVAVLLPANASAAVRIAIIDSGATKHVDAAVTFTSFAGNEDPLIHGTKIAELVRQGNPDAFITMLQVSENQNGKVKPSNEAIVNAIQWAIQNNMDVVNMSLVIKYDDRVNTLVTEATEKHGIIFVAAAGNKSLTGHFATNANGYVGKRKSVVLPSFPSSNPMVISVGGLDSNGRIAKYSDKKADLYANGKILGQEGSSFACARITARIAKILQGRNNLTKEIILSQLK